MTSLGLRCSNKDFAYAVLAGSTAEPRLIDSGLHRFPTGYLKPHRLRWFLQEVETLIERHSVEVITMRAFEGRQGRGTSFEERIEHEAMAILAGGNQGLKRIHKKRRNTLAKDFGLKGKARYLAQLETEALPEYEGAKPKIQEAMLVAWSELP